MIWPDGTLSPETQVAVVGSGMISAQSTVETFLEVIGLSPQKFDLRKALPEETAKLVAIKGLLKAYKSDTGTGDHIFMRAIRLDGVNNTTVAEVDALKNKLEEGDKI